MKVNKVLNFTAEDSDDELWDEIEEILKKHAPGFNGIKRSSMNKMALLFNVEEEKKSNVYSLMAHLQDKFVLEFTHKCKRMKMGEMHEDRYGPLLVTVLREGDDDEPDMSNYFYIRVLDDEKKIIKEKIDIYFDDLEEEIRSIIFEN